MTDAERVTVRLSPARIAKLDALVAADDVTDRSTALRLGIDFLVERCNRCSVDEQRGDTSLSAVAADALEVDHSILTNGGIVDDE